LVVSTAAIFLVGGGILVHDIGPLHHPFEAFSAGLGGILASVVPPSVNAMLGMVAGVVVLGVVTWGGRLIKAVRR
jgi:hypothetical protein